MAISQCGLPSTGCPTDPESENDEKEQTKNYYGINLVSTTATPQKCTKDEQWSDCALLPVSCQRVCPNAPPTGIMCAQVCHEGCVCKPGYFRDPRKGYKCVEEDKC
uniref:TIL domain-containing protein n=1 Tax=Romanomermis culicivorax TaxID=13658 RepID=A0A915HZL0_ROMCU